MAPPIESNNQVARVAVKPAPFWKADPKMWFARLEAQFSLADITVDSTKFNYVVTAIEPELLNSVSDILIAPPAENQYEAIKARLIAAHSESEESKFRKLLQGLELGDQRPSQLLSRMKNLAGETVGEPLLKSMWLSRLPQNTQSILAALSDDLPQLATVADKISDLASPATINSTSVSQTSLLEQQMLQLTKQINELTAIVSNGERSRERRNNYFRHDRRRSRSRSRSRRFKEPSNNLCFYHTNFGERAKKCSPPCSFQQAEN